MTDVTIYARPTRLVASHGFQVVQRSGALPTTIPAALASVAGDGSGVAEWQTTGSYLGDPLESHVGPDAAANVNADNSCYFTVGFHAWTPPPLGTDVWYKEPKNGVVRMFWVDWSTEAHENFSATVKLLWGATVLDTISITDGIATAGGPGEYLTLTIPDTFPDGQPFGMGHIGGLTVRCDRVSSAVSELYQFGCQGMELRFTASPWDGGGDDDELLKGDDEMIWDDKRIKVWSGVTATPTALEIEMPYGMTRLLVGHEMSGSPSTGGYCSLENGFVTTTHVPASIACASIARSTTTLTVTTTTPHLLRVGDAVTISGSNQAIFNRAFVVATVPTANSFTAAIANTGATSATGGSLVPASAYVPHHGDGFNIKASATTSSYSSIFKNCGPVVRLTCTITDGVHSVWYRLLP